jgi:translation initiation factor 2 beta subunit (eIF-2beta)/eIF-5
MSGFEECPTCKSPALPIIRSESRATGAMCQKCLTVFERSRIEQYRVEKAAEEAARKKSA